MSKSSRVKEEERIEGIIRNLLKLPENRRCMNCNSLGPQYVCTTFWTFVCTNCSGVHREFTHRVKSVSMAKFNAEEINALQAGGNERARQLYFKAWDPHHHSFPDGSNQNRLRDFIKHVYVDRKFSGERNLAKLAMVQTGANEGPYERCFIERPSLGGRINDRSPKYYIEERRSPRNKPDIVRSSSHRNRPVHFEVVDDRFRDNGFGSGRRSEPHRPYSAESRAASRSPVSQKSREGTSPPVVRPVNDILGDNVPRLQVGQSPKATDSRGNQSPGHGQKTASSTDPVNSVSLIDFSADPEPPYPAAAPQTQQMAPSTEGGNGASDCPKVNSLESILFGYSDAQSTSPHPLSGSVAATVSASPTNIPAVSNSDDAPAVSPVGQPLPITHRNHLYAFSSTGVLNNQSWTPSSAPNAQVSSSACYEESTQPNSKAGQVGAESQALVVEAKSCGRMELPADLFASSYASCPAPNPSWQVHPPHGMGFSMQYHPTAMAVPAFPSSAKSRNPFDLTDDGPDAQVPVIPSMYPVRGALPNLQAPTALLHASDIHSSQLMQPQASPYASIVPQQLPSYGASFSPGEFDEQLLPNNMPFSRPRNINTISRGEDAFASLNPIQQPSSSRYPGPTTPNSSSSAGGNPFG